ncbi:MAG: hypothetical protein KFB95_06430 [Simkaniaceae bacterium]|nr:MAG: hypothetical protein KFB95_06430 [Simkaniaceae bacterium]
MATPGIFSNTSQNAKLFATFVVGSAALIAGKKGIMWAGNKAYNMAAYCGNGMMNTGKWAGNTFMDGVHFTLKDGGVAGPTSAGILAGTAIGLTYKYSAIAASHQFPIKKPGHQVGNRSIVMATSVFALTLLAVRYSNSKFSSHQMSLAGALSYASIATIASLAIVGITADKGRRAHGADKFTNYPERLVELLSTSFTSDASRFWAGKRSEEPAAEYISARIEYGRFSSEDASRIARAIENSQYKGQALTILNELLTEYRQNPDRIAMIFTQLPERRQAELRERLEKGIKQSLPATAHEIEAFWADLDEETPAEFVGALVDHGFTQGAAKRCAQYIEAHDEGRQTLAILNALVTDQYKDPRSVAMIFMQLDQRRQGQLRQDLSQDIQEHLPPTPADSMRFWRELEGTPAGRIFEELPRGQYLRLEENNAQRLAFFIENYQGGREIATILNALQETHEVEPEMVAALFTQLSEAKQRQVKAELNQTLQQWLPGAHREMEFDTEEQEYGVHDSIHARKETFSWNESAQMGIYAGLASGVATAVAYLGVKSIFAFGEAFPMINGSIPAAVIVAPTFVLARGELSKEKYNLRRKQQELYSMAIAAILGTALIPTLSSYMLKKKVGYLASAGYSLAPIVGMFLMKHAAAYAAISADTSSRRQRRERSGHQYDEY